MVNPPNFRTPGVEPIRTCVWQAQFLRKETTWVQMMISCRARCLAQRCIRTTPRLIWTARAALRVMETRGTNTTPPFRVKTPCPPSSSFIQKWCTPRAQRTEGGAEWGFGWSRAGGSIQRHVLPMDAYGPMMARDLSTDTCTHADTLTWGQSWKAWLSAESRRKSACI